MPCGSAAAARTALLGQQAYEALWPPRRLWRLKVLLLRYHSALMSASYHELQLAHLATSLLVLLLSAYRTCPSQRTTRDIKKKQQVFRRALKDLKSLIDTCTVSEDGVRSRRTPTRGVIRTSTDATARQRNSGCCCLIYTFVFCSLLRVTGQSRLCHAIPQARQIAEGSEAELEDEMDRLRTAADVAKDALADALHAR